MFVPEGFINTKDIHFTDTPFKSLMQKRIYKVLILCSNYDYFMLEEDGRIDEHIFNEYVSLNLRYPPSFLHADKITKASRLLKNGDIDLIISMLSSGSDIFEMSKSIKADFPHIPIVILTHFSREISLRLQNEDLSAIDYVFSWLGHTSLLLAIIKLIEDKMNVEHDVREVGVQTILLVEDSIRFYSSYLPTLYQIILKQSHKFMTEGLNEHREMMRMRGRPKLLLATSYEEAIDLFETYKENLLGVISDISYKRKGVKDQLAGIRLTQHIRASDHHVPILLQSSDKSNEKYIDQLNVGFIHKYSKTLMVDLRNYMSTNLAFGDFVFRYPDGTSFDKASDLSEMQKKIRSIPEESLRHHFSHNDFSRWLNARAFFSLAKKLKYLTIDDFKSVGQARDYIHDLIVSYRTNEGSGVIAKFNKSTYDQYFSFARIGQGQLGGKARGLAFIDTFIKRSKIASKFPNVSIGIPRTVVLCTDVFDEFIEKNDLYEIALADKSDEEILSAFEAAELPAYIDEDLQRYLENVQNPVAVRSSSVLEDSHYQPFAGIYSTIMVQINTGRMEQSLRNIKMAIKNVYASVFYKSSKLYMEATHNLIDEEKMGIILQEVTGARYENYFYPTFSGVARSINFYPIEPETAEDGIANVAFGLGKTIVDGGVSLRFSPKYPKKILQLSSTDMALRDTQKNFYALDLNGDGYHPSIDDSANLVKLPIKAAEKHRAMNFVASTYDYHHNILRTGPNHEGRKVITFTNILSHNVFPLAEILTELLSLGQKEMNNPVEIEFAVNLEVPPGTPSQFSFLQIRPIVEDSESQEVDIDDVDMSQVLIYSQASLGNGQIEGIKDFVYIKPQSFNAAHSRSIGQNIELLNDKFLNSKTNYILVGPGRWGSSDPWLGIPVKWSQISAARLIVEAGLENYRIDPSQGTHFFQNLTSFRVGYFTINPYIKDGYYDLDFLNQQPAVFEDEYIRHVRFDEQLVIKIDGKTGRGVVFKPNAQTSASDNSETEITEA